MSNVKCDACGLPPLPNKRLLECTRCKQAYYHDRRCQQNHYPKHKATCRRIAAAAAAAAKEAGTTSHPTPTADAPTRKSLVECRSIDGKGRSLIATSPLAIGCHPLPTTTNDGLCEPIAHPVLIESMRTSRCAFCFQLIHNSSVYTLSSAYTFHRHCSPQCQSLDKNWMVETNAAQKLPSPPSPTALSCSRILRNTISSKEYNELCWNIDVLSQEEKEVYKSVMMQCHLFLRAMGDSAALVAHDLLHPDPIPAYQFMSRLSMNGFTISTSEQLPIGHGIYCGASMINHSCRPNAVPTFWLRDCTPPMLQVTVCQSVSAEEEVTIACCDVSTPMRVRSGSLWTNYKFICDCPLCQDTDRDDDVVGLKCTTERCRGRVRCASPGEEEGEKQKLLYQCNSCGNTSFDCALQVQAETMEQMKRMDSVLSNDSDSQRFHKRVGKEARQIYDLLKRHCRLQTSYFPAWSADLFVYWCANALKSCINEQEQLGMCHEALVVINECRPATRFCNAYPGNLSWHIKQGMEAKLRLFVNPMDMEAFGMLRNARRELLVYYPSSDCTLMSLDESLAAYSFS
ncbi:hypothetical protein ACHAXR_010680 [Thalassiosira sp. AJA248-18]